MFRISQAYIAMTFGGARLARYVEKLAVRFGDHRLESILIQAERGRAIDYAFSRPSHGPSAFRRVVWAERLLTVLSSLPVRSS